MSLKRLPTPMLAALLVGVLSLAARQPEARQVSNDPAAAVPRVTLAEFKKLVDRDAVLVVDVRDLQSYAGGHIPGAILIPFGLLEKESPTLRQSKKPIVAYCS
jgi:3-mercaptopyruvate sulfurtransferase SseA